MNRDELERLVDLHGGDPERWPEALRGPALALARRDPFAKSMLEDAAAADGTVKSAASVAPAGDLAARIVAAATGDEEAIFGVTPAGIAGVLAGSLGLAGAGYVAAAAIAGLIVPAALLETVSAVVATGIPGGF